MRVFKDTTGREWTVAITVATLKRVKASLSVELLALMDDKAAGLWALLDDPVRLIDTLFVVCRKQADAAGIDDEAFGEAMAGASLQAAADAFLGAYTDFFPTRGAARVLQKMHEKTRAAIQILEKDANAELDAMTSQSLAEKLKSSFGSSPAESASTLTLSRSAS